MAALLEAADVRLLDRYFLREWAKIFTASTVGFPLVAIILELTDKLDDYLGRGLTPGAIALGYLYSLPEKVFLILPAAVLFATVFSVGAMSRHSELTAGKASGQSFHRLVAPALLAAGLAAVLALALGELAPILKRRQGELLGEREMHAVSSRFNFVYRADQGWVYTIRSVDAPMRAVNDALFEREGTGPAYPSLVVESRRGSYSDSKQRWTLKDGALRIIPGPQRDLVFTFDSMRLRSFLETPAALLAEPKDPDEMRYGELARYIGWLERSGGDARKLRVDLALKIAIPFTCIIIAIFGAPLAVTAPRAGGAFGIGVSLATTVVFLTLVQLSKAVGAGGLLPPTLAAWAPNVVFGAVGMWLARRAPT
jgi:lipopolysaccharide export system permease protein